MFLNELDHFVKEKLCWRDYIRYCDDFCLFGNNKRDLWRVRKKILHFVQNELMLDFSRSSVYPVSRGFDFIGYRHFNGFILLRKSAAKRIKNSVLNIARYRDFSEKSVGQLAAYHGWMKWANCWRLKRKIQSTVGREFGGKASRFIKDKFWFDDS